MNHAVFTHENSKEITRLKKAFVEERTCDEFVPCPTELKSTVSPNRDGTQVAELIEKYGHADWYSFNTSEWGTKWDFGGQKDDILESKRGRVVLRFDTAWAPPVVFYEKMEELGFTVEAYYYEPGMNFCGKFYDGNDDYYEIPSTSEEAADQLPSDIDEMFSISEYMADREAEEDENERDCNDE